MPLKCSFDLNRLVCTENKIRLVGVVFLCPGAVRSLVDFHGANKIGNCKKIRSLKTVTVATDRTTFKHRKTVNSPIGLCSDPHLLWWISDNDWNDVIPSTSSRYGIFAKSAQRDHFATKCTVVKFVQPWKSTSPNREITAGSAMCPECPMKNWRGTFFWLHPVA